MGPGVVQGTAAVQRYKRTGIVKVYESKGVVQGYKFEGALVYRGTRVLE